SYFFVSLCYKERCARPCTSEVHRRAYLPKPDKTGSHTSAVLFGCALPIEALPFDRPSTGASIRAEAQASGISASTSLPFVHIRLAPRKASRHHRIGEYRKS